MPRERVFAWAGAGIWKSRGWGPRGRRPTGMAILLILGRLSKTGSFGHFHFFGRHFYSGGHGGSWCSHRCFLAGRQAWHSESPPFGEERRAFRRNSEDTLNRGVFLPFWWDRRGSWRDRRIWPGLCFVGPDGMVPRERLVSRFDEAGRLIFERGSAESSVADALAGGGISKGLSSVAWLPGMRLAHGRWANCGVGRQLIDNNTKIFRRFL